jgi:hypothetical protein
MSYESALHTSSPLAAPDPTDPRPLPLGRRVAAVFFRPVRLFEHLRERPEWMGPLLIAIGVGILAIVLLPDPVFVEAMQGATTRRGDPVTITSAPEVVALWERLRLSLGVAVTHPLKLLLIAGFLTLVFRTLLGGPAAFRHYLSVSAHVLLISALGALLALPLQRATVDAGTQLSLGLLFPGLAASGLPGSLLAAVNPFTVWMLVVMAVGVGVVNRRRSPLVPLLFLLGIYFAGLTAVTLLTG